MLKNPTKLNLFVIVNKYRNIAPCKAHDKKLSGGTKMSMEGAKYFRLWVGDTGLEGGGVNPLIGGSTPPHIGQPWATKSICTVNAKGGYSGGQPPFKAVV